MRSALFKCFGTGKLVFFEEIEGGKLRFLFGYSKAAGNAREALEWLESQGVEKVEKGNFEWHFDHYNDTLMRCWKK